MIEKNAIIENELGIHVRPSGLIISETQSYDGKIILKAKGMEMELNSIMDLLALGLEKGNELNISVSGPDEEDFSEKLVDLFQFHFDFPPK
jgi:phosphocarrier protein HPr